MRAATALLEAPLEGQKLALRRSGFPRTLASRLRALQPANTNRENPCGYDGSASESCNWTSKDPIRFRGRQLNLYDYGHCDPVNQRDPRGTDFMDAIACAACVAAATGTSAACSMLEEKAGAGAVDFCVEVAAQLGSNPDDLCNAICNPDPPPPLPPRPGATCPAGSGNDFFPGFGDPYPCDPANASCAVGAQYY